MDPPRRHNPNYPPPSYSAYTGPAPPPPPPLPPSAAQHPATQQPPFDPFNKRDPFMPPRDQPPPSPGAAFWHADAQAPRPLDLRRDTLQPAPGPPPSPFSAGPTLFEADHMRRRSLGGTFHHTSPLEPSHPSQTPNFMKRNMPPPSASSPQPAPAPSQHNGSLPRSHLPTPPPPGAAPLLGPPSYAPRQNNMSISSIMGSENASSHRPNSSWSSSTPRGPLSGPASFQGPPSPTRSTHPLPRQIDPDGHPRPYTPAGRTLDTQLAGSQFGPHSLIHGSPPRRHDGQDPPRPFSQPLAHEPHRGPRDPFHGPTHSEPDASFDDARTSLGRVGRARAETDLYRRPPPPPGRDAPSAPVFGPHSDRVGPFNRPSWASPVVQEAQRYAPVEYGPPSRPAVESHPPQYMPSQPAAPMYGPLPRPDELPNGHPGEMQRYGPQPRPIDGTPMQPSLSQDGYHTRPIALDARLRRSLEESQMAHKSVLGGLYNDQRKIDRGSPLPQAVQGVSAQPLGLARDPHVTSEFGKMFSGLGSGVGSTPQPVAQSLGRPQSPFQMGDDRIRSSLYDYDGFPRRGRNKRPLDDDRNDSGDSADGRASPMPLPRGAKKMRHGHHHHHLPPHHHHFARRDEDVGYDALRRVSETPTGLQRTGSATGHHHHHHHHHLGHHHHHTLRPQTLAPPAQLRRPTIEIRTSPLVHSVASKPRQHLGSQLYDPQVKLPSLSTPVELRHSYALAPNAIPRFEGKENCTFTIHIPRSYLDTSSREHIVAQRRVWGTDVYTDDSDPLCAAVHGGWLRGAWADDVDEELLELDRAIPEGDQQPVEGRQTSIITTPPPAGPKPPPEDKDLHITILILPPLEKYASSTWHGVRSRAWGGDHDGMSYKILQIEFMDDGLAPFTCGSGRTGDKILQKRRTGPSAAQCGVGLPIVGAMKESKMLRMAQVGA